MMIKRNSIFLSIMVFFLIFAPYINIGLGFFGDTLAFMCLLLIGYYIFSELSFCRFTFKKEFIILCSLLLLCFIYTLIVSTFYLDSVKGFTAALRPIRALIVFFGVYVFVGIYKNYYGQRTSENLIKDIYIALGIHAVIMLIELVLPSFRNAIYHYTFADLVIDYNQKFRMAGLTMGGGAQLSVFQSIGVILFPFSFKLRKKMWGKIIDVLLLFVLVISIVLSGRSGLLAIILFMPFSIYLSKANFLFKFPKNKKYGAALIVLFVFFLTFFFANDITIVEKVFGQTTSIYYKIAKYRAFETFRNFKETGVLSDRTIDILIKSHLKFPDTAVIFLFGDPSILDVGVRGIDSDIGYVRFLFGYGILGSLLYYSFYILSAIYAYSVRNIDKKLFSATLLCIFVILFFHMKEIFVFARIGFSITSLLTIACFYVKRSEDNVIDYHEKEGVV